MKKMLVALTLGLFLFSCQKTGSLAPKPDEKKYDVTFTTGFGTSVTTMSTDKSKTTNGVNLPVAGNIDNLYYRVYNASGTLVNGIDQASTATGFGTIADKLPAGTYSVFIGGSKGALYMGTSQTTNFSNSYFEPSTFNFWNDTFFNQFSITVAASALSQAVSLNRAVGAVDVTLTDAIPSNAAKITLIFANYESVYSLTGDNWLSNSKSTDFALSTSDVGTKNKVFSVFAGSSSATTPLQSNLTIRAYDSSNGLITEKTVASVPVYRNKRTAVTGALFPTGSTTNQNVGFTVTVNTDWGTPPSTITF